jgi:peroxiredoxin
MCWKLQVRKNFSKAVCRVAAFLLILLVVLTAPKASAEDNSYFLELAKVANIEIYPLALRAPPFRLPAVGGDAFSNNDLKGRIVLLTFWASWCATCKAEFPSLERLQAMFDREEFQVVGIAVSDTPNSVMRFLGGRSPPFPILLDTDKKIAEQYRAAGVPVSYLLDREGRIIAAKSGEHHWDDPETIAMVRYLLTKGNT